ARWPRGACRSVAWLVEFRRIAHGARWYTRRMESTRTVWRWLADWIAVRRPARLIVDGLFVMFWSGVLYIVWAFWWQMNEDALHTAGSRGMHAFSLLLATAHHGLFDLGVVIVAAGCARLIAEGRQAPREAERVHTPTGVMP